MLILPVDKDKNAGVLVIICVLAGGASNIANSAKYWVKLAINWGKFNNNLLALLPQQIN